MLLAGRAGGGADLLEIRDRRLRPLEPRRPAHRPADRGERPVLAVPLGEQDARHRAHAGEHELDRLALQQLLAPGQGEEGLADVLRERASLHGEVRPNEGGNLKAGDGVAAEIDLFHFFSRHFL